MQDRTNALSKHVFDDEYYKRLKKKAEQRKKDHKKNNNNNDDDDSDDEEMEASFAQAVKNKQYACYKCRKLDHLFSKCPLKIPKKDWWVNCMIQGMQDDNDDDDDQLQSSRKSKKSSRNKTNVDWSGHQCVVIKDNVKELFDQPKMKTTNTPLNLNKKLMLDSGSTIEATIQNSDFLTNIRTSENPIVMSTNARYKKMGLNGDLPGIGVVKYNGNQLTNILGFSHMADRYCIEYDNLKEDAFKVHTKNGIAKFTRDECLYTYQPSNTFFDSITEKKGLPADTEPENKNSNKSDSYNSLDFVMTKKGNRDGYTDRHYKCAKCAWKLYINTGGGGFENLNINYNRISLRTTL